MYKKYYKKRSNFHWLENFIILLIIGFIGLIVYLNFDGISDVLRFDDTEENFTEVEQTSNTVFNYDVQSNSVIALEVITPDSTNIGSGTIIEKEVFTGYYQYTVLTNAHVINNYQDIKVVYKDSAGDYVRITDVNVVRSDDTLDLALLTFNSDISFYPVTIQDGPAVIGEDVYAIGTDLNLTFYNSLSSGQVSGITRTFADSSSTFIQHTAEIVSGNSGGALFNAQGKLIGIHCLRVISGNDTLYFSIDIDTVLGFIGN